MPNRSPKPAQKSDSPSSTWLPATFLRWQTEILSAFLVLIVFSAFLPVLRNGFVNYDDDLYVTDNSQVKAGLTWTGVKWAFTKVAAANWHPVTWLSHMADCQLFGLNARGAHLTNLLFHAANTLLVFVVLRKLTGAAWRSFFVAAFFGVHPLHVESVAWVSERKDVMSTLFFMITIWAYVGFVRAGQKVGSSNVASHQRRQKGLGLYVLALLFFTLGLLSKPMLVTMPFVLLLLDFWPLQRDPKSQPAGAPGSNKVLTQDGPSSQVRFWWRLVLEKIPFFTLSAGVSLATYFVQKSAGALWHVSQVPLSARIENALVSYCRYLAKVFWPIDLSVFYTHPGQWPMSAWALAGLALVGISLFAIVKRRSAPFWLVGWLWFLGTLVPVIGLVQVGWQSMADRYMYIPLIGLEIALAWEAGTWAERWPAQNWSAAAVPVISTASVLVIVCVLLTRGQLGYWRDSENLFRHALLMANDSWVAHHNLGMALLGKRQFNEAALQFREAIRIRPTGPEHYNGLGEALLGQGRLDDAMELFHKAIDFKPDLAVAHNNLGIILIRKGLFDQAMQEFDAAIKAKPGYAKAYSNLGLTLQGQGRLDDAIVQLEEGVRLAPEDPEARNNLAMALGRKGRFEEAMVQLNEAVKLRPKDPQLYHNIGVGFSRQARWDEAIVNFDRALELKPESPDTHVLLATALVQKGRRKDAIDHLKQALKLRPGYELAEKQLREIEQRVATP